jgi:phosphopantothenoylcysteine decarboxylase/phosphopantothenate--cysteine ligase
VSLADRADLIVIYPASCNIMAKIAGGICDDLLTCTVISSKAPVLFAPAMNDNMYKHKFTARNLKTLKDAGYYFAGPVEGRLACGHTAIGHVAAAADVFAEAKKILK